LYRGVRICEHIPILPRGNGFKLVAFFGGVNSCFGLRRISFSDKMDDNGLSFSIRDLVCSIKLPSGYISYRPLPTCLGFAAVGFFTTCLGFVAGGFFTAGLGFAAVGFFTTCLGFVAVGFFTTCLGFAAVGFFTTCLGFVAGGFFTTCLGFVAGGFFTAGLGFAVGNLDIFSIHYK
jgi:hypothetical protein